MTESKSIKPIKGEKIACIKKGNRIPYTRTMSLLEQKIPNTTPAELAAWVFIGRKHGGLTAYCDPHKLKKQDPDDPKKITKEGTEFSYSIYALTKEIDYIKPLMRCWFYHMAIYNFKPKERFITGKALIERWEKLPHIQSEDFIQGLVYDSRLTDFHPITGFTKWSNEDYLPNKATAIFSLSEIKKIEKEYFDENNSSETREAEWLIKNPEDPEPVQPWYTPARFFARRLIEADLTLLKKRDRLASKVNTLLKDAKIYKRGGKLPPDSGTIKKAFTNVNLSKKNPSTSLST